ncbi:MAG: hypothetical protein ACRDYA_21600, partial [Egibacteraceae bacterium]
MRAHGRWRRAGWPLIAVGLLAATAVFPLRAVGAGDTELNRIAAWATIWALPLGMVLVVVDRVRSRQEITPEVLAVEADRLAAEALKGGSEQRARLLGTHMLDVTAANVAFERSLVRFRDAGGRAAGDLDTVMDYYQQLRPARMVILGVPGAGKTVLLLE